MNAPMLHALMLVLLLVGAGGFAAHLYAQWRFARTLRTRYPDKWRILEAPEAGPVSRIRIWARLQRVLRSRVTELFEDAELTRWHRVWRFAPWVAWPCWIGMLLLQAFTGVH